MQNKGLVTVFAILFGLVSLYQLSFTFISNKVESDFRDLFNLNIQIFRKSKDLWLQTSATDDWSLEKQNSKGLHSMGIYE